MRHLRLIVLATSLVLVAASSANAYDPLLIPTEVDVEIRLMSIEDQSRQRQIPIKVYLPASSQSAALVLFSHGLGGSREGGTYLGKHWAARGYLVVSMQHHGSDASVWKNVRFRERMDAMRDAASRENSVARYQDVAAVLDQLETWNRDDSHALFGRINEQHVGMSGHSFGAVTTQGVSGQAVPFRGQLFTDSRIKAAVMLSPSTRGRVSPHDSFGKVSIPWMLMTGTEDTSPINDTTVADRRQVYPGLPLTIHKYELVLDGAKHSAFGDSTGRLGEGRRNPNHHRVILALSTAFWDAHLLDKSEAKDWLHSDQVRHIMDDADLWQLNLPPKR